MSEVAELAGVSKPTVSRVLAGTSGVAAPTRAKVLRAVEELGYRPDVLARALRGGRTDDVAVVVPFVTNPSAVERLRGIVDGLRGSGHTLTMFDVERPDEVEAQFDSVAARRPAGVVALSLVPSDDRLSMLQDAGIPLVVVEATVSHPNVASVNVDDVAAGQMAAEYLFELGHRRIAFVGDAEDGRFGFVASARRRLGFQGAHDTCGVELDPLLVRTVPHGRGYAMDTATDLLRAADPPTAFFAASDTQALGILDAARLEGVAVPSALSVVGCDDVAVSADLGLSTVSVGLYDSGVAAARLIRQMIEQPGLMANQVTLPSELKPRMTSGPAPSST